MKNMSEDKTNTNENEKEEKSDIQKELENDFATNLFPLIQEYKQKLSTCEDNLQRALADYQN